MGLLDLLFGRRNSRDSTGLTVTPQGDSFEDRFLTLNKPHWFGECSRSPNRRWVISWRRGEADVLNEAKAGSRPDGRYLLYEATTQRVVLRGGLFHPTAGAVADNGAFVLGEINALSALQSTLHACSAKGDKLLLHKIHALILTTAISKSGRYAICTTGNSKHEDGGSLFLFDLLAGKQVFITEPEAWSTDYYIDEDRIEVVANVRGLGAFRYDRNGQFIDRALLEQAILQRGDYSSTITTAERILQHSEPSIERVRETLAAVLRARKHGADQDSGWKAAALKVQGMAYEALSEIPNAIAAYEQALAINPKIGVKRRLASLQKRNN